MKFSRCVCATAALCGFANAFPALAAEVSLESRQNNHAFIFNPPGSIRAPCPGLNTMANHGKHDTYTVVSRLLI